MRTLSRVTWAPENEGPAIACTIMSGVQNKTPPNAAQARKNRTLGRTTAGNQLGNIKKQFTAPYPIRYNTPMWHSLRSLMIVLVIAVLLLPVAYVLSAGPAIWLVHHHRLDPLTYCAIYEPLGAFAY